MTEQVENTVDLETLLPVIEADENLKGELAKRLVSEEDVRAYLETDAGETFLQPIRDSAISKGVEAYKRNKFDAELEKRIKEQFPDVTPEQKRLAKLEAQIAESDKARLKAELTMQTQRLVSERNLPPEVVEMLVADTPERTRINVNQFELTWNSALEAGVESRLKSTGRTMKPSNTATDIKRDNPNRDPMEMSAKERNELFTNNPAEFHALFG